MVVKAYLFTDMFFMQFRRRVPSLANNLDLILCVMDTLCSYFESKEASTNLIMQRFRNLQPSCANILGGSQLTVIRAQKINISDGGIWMFFVSRSENTYKLIYSASTDLRMVSSARWYSLSARSNSLLRKLTCSSVADIPVLSLPLLQHVSRSPGHNQL